MKVLAVFVLVFVTIAYAQIRLYPESMRDKWAQWDRENENPMKYQRIVNGQTVGSGGRPFQVLLARNGAFTCGGSLIASNKVATAAHCVYGNEGSPTSFSVRYNTLTQTGGQSITVSSISRHGSYNSGTINYDFAVLTLASAFTPGTNAATITIATSVATGATAISSGWGRTTGGGAVSQNLMQTSYSVLSQSDCQSRMGSINTITTQMICGYTSGTGICNGDSGGPMTVGGQLVGIHSWVVGSCLTSYPSVSANAVTARTWLLAQ